jgi:hypothetical protein
VNLSELADDMLRFSRLIDQGLTTLRDQVVEYAEAERDYRKLKATAYASMAGDKRTVPEKEAEVDGATADARYRRDLAEGMKRAALESVKARQSQLSSAQTLANGYKAEADFDRTGPR